MSVPFLSFSHLVFGYPSAAGVLFDDLSCVFPGGWTGVVGFNGGGKTTLLKLAAGELRPESGRVNREGRLFLCSQECDAVPPELEELIVSPGRFAAELRDTLGIGSDWAVRWHTLSFGERKRSQIGCALIGGYDILLLDEPTNHLDAASSEQLRNALRSFGGIGLLVSHDRTLLDEFCEQCLFIEPGSVIMRSGGYSEGKRRREIERETLRATLSTEKAELDRMNRELQRRRGKAEAAQAKNSKRKLARHDHDGKGRIDAARVTGRSSAADNLVKRQRVRVERQAAEVAGLGTVADESYRFDIPYGVRSKRNVLFSLPAGRIGLGGGRFLDHPALEMAPADRIGIAGGNGLGKSTLIRRILPELRIDPERMLYLPQEIGESEREAIAEKLASLSVRQRGSVMRIIHNLGSSPERVLASERLSPGELRKLHLALGVNDDIELLVMDEPTNHLDLPSVECLETALAAAQCALLLVSHDRRFLDRLCPVRWLLAKGRLQIERS